MLTNGWLSRANAFAAVISTSAHFALSNHWIDTWTSMYVVDGSWHQRNYHVDVRRPQLTEPANLPPAPFVRNSPPKLPDLACFYSRL